MKASDIIFYVTLVPMFVFISRALISKKKRKKPVISAILSFVVAIVLLMSFEDYLFFKADAVEILQRDGISLKDDFQISSHDIFGSRGKLYERFELQISDDDEARIISTIKTSPYQTDSASAANFIDANFMNTMSSVLCQKKYYDGQRGYRFSRQTYEKPRAGYTSTYHITTVSENTSTLSFQSIEQ